MDEDLTGSMSTRILSPLRPAAAALLLGALAVAACSSQVPSSGAGTRRTAPSSSAASAARVDQSNAAPGPTGQGSFDAVHAAQVLGPSVGLIIVSSRAGTAEGSGFVISAQGGTSYLATNNH